MADFNFIQKVFIYAIPVLFAITVHEVAHGWIASKLGDQTAKMMGRLTLNPIKHVDPIGTVVVPIIILLVSPFILGWAKPVPVDWRNLKRPKLDMAWVAIAGPVANLVMMIFWAILAKIIVVSGLGNYHYSVPVFAMAMVGIGINIVLMVLNLIPIPPLDGSRVLSALLPPRAAFQYNRLEPYGLIIVLLLLFSGVLGKFFFPVVDSFNSAVKSLIF